MIGHYLVLSERLLLMLDVTYLRRLWCVFELATYMALREHGKIHIYPISLGCCVGVVPALFGLFSVFLILFVSTPVLSYVVVVAARLIPMVEVLNVIMVFLLFMPLTPASIFVRRRGAKPHSWRRQDSLSSRWTGRPGVWQGCAKIYSGWRLTRKSSVLTQRPGGRPPRCPP